MAHPGGPSGGTSDASSRRLFVLQAVVVGLLLTLFGRLWFLQVASGSSLQAKADSSRNRQVITPALRGRILDDSGQTLVDNQSALIVTMSRTTLDGQKPKVRQAVLDRVGALLTIAPAQLARLVEPCTADNPPPLCDPGSPYQPVAVATLPLTGPHHASAFLVRMIQETVKEHQEDYPGVVVTSQAVRTYPVGGAVANTTLAAQTLGHLGPISSLDTKKLGAYAPEAALLTTTEDGKVTPRAGSVGLGGLEQEYDAALRGLDGDQTLTVDRAGDVDGVASTAAPVTGSDLVLNIDDGVQKAAEKALQDAIAHSLSMGTEFGAADDGAAAVVMTTDGRIVALASTPSFDETAYESETTYNRLLHDTQTPLNNRATTGIYAPGSSFKPITSAGLLANNVVSPGQGLPCPDQVVIGNQKFHNFEGESPGGGPLPFLLEVSCDTFFAQEAAQLWTDDGGYRNTAGEQKIPDHEYLAKMAKAFGFGSFTGSDIPEASPGIVLDRATNAKILNAGRADACKGAKTRPPGYLKTLDQENCTDGAIYREGNAAQFAIGQGSNLEVTPLQMARAYAAIANGGTLYAPTVGKALLRPDGSVLQTITPKATGKVPVPESDLQYIQQGMYEVTHGPSGTAKGVFGAYPVPVCGKTGTAEQDQINSDGIQTGATDTSWFGSFAPCSPDGTGKPKYVVMVVVPRSNQGAEIAAPAVREIYDAIYGVSDDGTKTGKVTRPNGPTTDKALPCYKANGTISAPSSSCAHPTAPPLKATVVVPKVASSATPLPVPPPADVPSMGSSSP